jgi:hypothetical protein
MTKCMKQEGLCTPVITPGKSLHSLGISQRSSWAISTEGKSRCGEESSEQDLARKAEWKLV